MATKRIPIDLRNPRQTSLAGNSYFNVIAMTNHDVGAWQFVKDVDGKIYGLVTVPDVIAGTPAAKIILICQWNATTGVARMNVANKCIAPDAEQFDAALTADTAQDVTVPGTARLTKTITFTVGDLANVAVNDLIVVEIFHEGAHANDTVAVDTTLLQAYLQIDV